MPTSSHTSAYVGGEWISAADGRRFAVIDPANGTEIANVVDCGAAEARAAISSACTAIAGWAARSAAERGAVLRRWRDLILADIDALATILTTEMGKPIAEARGEIAYGAAYLDWFAEEGKRAYGEVIPSPWGGSRVLTLRQPVGVVAAITPWNFPNAMVMRKVAPALAAGCTIIVKPAQDTPLSALAIAALASAAGLPPGVLNVLPTSRSAEVGDVLIASTEVRKLSFTGSTETGRNLLAAAASTVKRTSMELGGNAPFIVFDDANLDQAVNGAIVSKYRNAGQTCVCANRFLVEAGIYDRFVDLLARRTGGLKVGPGMANGTDVGPLINEAAVEKVGRLLAAAISDGARVVVGGRRHALGGLYFEPTVVAEVSREMEIAGVEIFGPVAPVLRFNTEAEAIELANDTPFGLAAYFYTANLGRAWRVAEALEFGMVSINEGILSSEVAPFGGVKQSGFGREGSRHGLEEYLAVKYLLMGGLAKNGATT